MPDPLSPPTGKGFREAFLTHGDIFQDPLMTANGHHPGEVVLSIYRDTGHPELGVRVDNGTTSFFLYQPGKIEVATLPTKDILRLLRSCGPFDLFFVVTPPKTDDSIDLERKHYLNSLALSRLRDLIR